MKVRMKVNLGTVDAGRHGLDVEKCQAGMEADVPEAAGTWLVEKGHAEAIGRSIKGVPAAAEILGVPSEEESPVSDENVGDATDDISRMRSREKLQHIIDSDPRVTVRAAAEKRLAEL